MAAAVPPRPQLRVPRPDSSSPAKRRVPTKSEPRLTLNSIDLELIEQDAPLGPSNSHQRATLVHPLGEDDPLDIVMNAVRGISCERAVEAASVCLAACVQAVGCRAAIAHLWDAREENFVIVYALGKSGSMLLNARHGTDDALLAEAFEKKIPRVVNFEGARAPLARHGIVGGAWSVLVAPVMEQGASLGAIELIDPLDGSCFDDRHVAAARYATQKLAELLRDVDATIGKLIAPPLDE
jgi:hypothetical protein